MNYSTLKYPSNISNRCTINQKPPTSRASIGHVSKQIVPQVAVPFTGIDVTESNRGPGKRVHRQPLGSSIRKTRSLGRIWLRHAPIQANGHTDARLEVWQFLMQASIPAKDEQTRDPWEIRRTSSMERLFWPLLHERYCAY